MDQISILGALVALGLSSWRLGSVLEAFWDRLERLLGPNLGPNMEPTWAKNRSKNRSFLGCLLGFIFGWIFVDFGCPNGAKLAPKWDQKSLFTWKGDFSKFVLWLRRGRARGYPIGRCDGVPPLAWTCKNGIQVGMHLGIDFSSILMVFGRQVGKQNGPKIDSKKHGKKHAKIKQDRSIEGIIFIELRGVEEEAGWDILRFHR